MTTNAPCLDCRAPITGNRRTRGLCPTCYRRHKYGKTLDKFPLGANPRTVTRERILAQYAKLRAEGKSRDEARTIIGVKRQYLNRVLHDAAAKGDSRSDSGRLPRRDTEAILDEYARLRPSGMTHRQIAAAIGCPLKSMEHILRKAAAAGDERSDTTLRAKNVDAPELVEPGENWRERAACRDEEPETFFPAAKGRPAERWIEEAKAICQRCPVRGECLSDALAFPAEHDWGIRGGLTEEERRLMRRRSVRAS